ncbi:hypothetical protein OHV13_26000 [Kitasatospora purpeofusca]|uniref:hypothetical protein n=1 Tax=Kitasatospora purpeofusca TaxID=67352 RepID=UPI00324BCA7A
MIENSVADSHIRGIVQTGAATGSTSRPTPPPPPNDGSEDGSPPGPDPVRVWAAYGVSLAAAFHVVAAALVLINRSR